MLNTQITLNSHSVSHDASVFCILPNVKMKLDVFTMVLTSLACILSLLRPGHTKLTPKNWHRRPPTLVSPRVSASWPCVALEHTAKTSADGQEARMNCACVSGNNSPYQQAAVVCIRKATWCDVWVCFPWCEFWSLSDDTCISRICGISAC